MLCESKFHDHSEKKEYITNKWCLYCPTETCLNCYPKERWVQCSKCYMDMCEDCYKIQNNHKDKKCWKYTENTILQNNYKGNWCNEAVFYEVFLYSQFIRDLCYSLPCDLKFIEILHYFLTVNYHLCNSAAELGYFFMDYMLPLYEQSSLYDFKKIELNLICLSNNENNFKRKELIKQYLIKEKYQEKIILINIMCYDVSNFVLNIDDTDCGDKYICQSIDSKKNNLFNTIKQNNFTCKDKILRKILIKHKIYNNLTNLIFKYSNIFDNHYIISFNPLKPMLYENNKKEIDCKFMFKKIMNKKFNMRDRNYSNQIFYKNKYHC